MKLLSLFLSALLFLSPVTVAGSTSAEALCQALADACADVEVQAVGTTAGLQAVLNGTAQVAAASRKLTEEETEQGLTAWPIARDAIAVVVSPQVAADGLTRQQLRDIWQGRTACWPDGTPIVTVSQQAGSGTRAAFDAAVASPVCGTPICSGNGSVKCTVASLSGAIGYYSAALGFEGVKVLAVDGYYPWQSEYPLWRSIDLVAKQSCPFIEFALSPAGQRIVRRQGYLPP